MKPLTSCVSSTASIHIALLNMLRMDKAHTQFFPYQIFAIASLEPLKQVMKTHQHRCDINIQFFLFGGGEYLHFWLYLIAQMLISF